MISTTYHKTPIGWVEIQGNEKSIVSIKVFDERKNDEGQMYDVIQLCIKQLDEYFAGKRAVFDIPLQFSGTAFQQKTWNALLSIPYGTTISYSDLADRVGSPRAYRAVGTANGKNQHWIVVPCHRVIAHDRTLGGYAGGLWRKQWLLDLESNNL